MDEMLEAPSLRAGSAPTMFEAIATRDRSVAERPAAMRVHAVLLLPTETPHLIEWQVAARFLVRWQISYLRAAVPYADVEITLVCGERGNADEWNALAAGTAAPRLHVIRTVDEFNPMARVQPHADNDVVLLMASPCLTDLPLGDTLAAHRRSNRSYTVVRARSGRGDPYLCVMNIEYAARNWPQLAPTLHEASLAKVLRTQAPARLQIRSGHARVLWTGAQNDLGAFERFWVKHIAPVSRGSRGQMDPMRLISPAARIASTAKLRGPVIVGDGVTLGNRSSVGPWVALDAGAIVGDDCWLDRAFVGSNAVIASESCVYQSILAPTARMSGENPVLKAHLYADGQAPILQPSLGSRHALSRGQRTLKRLLDIIIASVGLLVLLPFLLVIVLLCAIFQGWPVLFRHERLGQNNRKFRVFKFRSMHRQSHHHARVLQELEKSDRFKISNDPRVTGLGRVLRKTSLDELPQILNVLFGDMSVIGPRPIVTNEAARYGPYVGDLLRTLPGVTGLWQVSGRSRTTYQRRIMLDVQYGDTASVWQDVKILLRTVPAVLLLRGAE